jgi:putative FmdB family regulatory protein
MPIYGYKCDRHGIFEELRQMAQSGTPARCPNCGKSCERHFQAPGKHKVTFRDGWHPGAGRNFSTQREFATWLDVNGAKVKT